MCSGSSRRGRPVHHGSETLAQFSSEDTVDGGSGTEGTGRGGDSAAVGVDYFVVL